MTITLKRDKLNKLELEKKATRKDRKGITVSPETPQTDTPVPKEPTLSDVLTSISESQGIQTQLIQTLSQRNEDGNLREILSAIENVQQTQTLLIEALATQETEKVTNWEFAVERDQKGAIKKIFAQGA